ncbi:dihydroxyacetone kinase subunit DhaL [Kineococcus xinjiangensis]|uniref:dihydroxyacetone kinase subunit DhaL n=1 Tax=Kineococcus xinjiangensis TaxID=512762 RepID=UPI001B80568D|nr:dihydroxyacetone kinase subunit DhaL [Kineococcus xinjiangensis]
MTPQEGPAATRHADLSVSPAQGAAPGAEDAEELRVEHGPGGGRRAVMDVDRARNWWEGFAREVEERSEELTELDRISGDGDFGTNLRSAVRKARARLEAGQPRTVGEVFTAVSLGFLDTGGTSGPLFGMFFREFAKACEGLPVVGSDVLARGALEGVRTVQRLGGAQVGDKTAVDAMAPAAEALQRAVDAGAEVTAAMGAAYRAAADGARSTTAMRARRGRASYVGEVARGVVDPGALAVAWFYERGATAA